MPTVGKNTAIADASRRPSKAKEMPCTHMGLVKKSQIPRIVRYKLMSKCFGVGLTVAS